MNTAETTLLENISNEYVNPDPGRVVDQHILRMIVERTLPWVTGPTVLELGFGDDQWTRSIIQKHGHSHIVDASQVLLERAKSKYGDAISTNLSLFENFNPGPQFDTIISSYVLEHVEDPVQILRRTVAWLRPNGRVIAIVPNANSLHRILAVCMGLQSATTDLGATDHQMGHRRVYTVSAMERDIQSAGLEVVDRAGYFTKLLPQRMMTAFSDELLKGCMDLGQKLPMENAASIAFCCRVKSGN